MLMDLLWCNSSSKKSHSQQHDPLSPQPSLTAAQLPIRLTTDCRHGTQESSLPWAAQLELNQILTKKWREMEKKQQRRLMWGIHTRYEDTSDSNNTGTVSDAYNIFYTLSDHIREYIFPICITTQYMPQVSAVRHLVVVRPPTHLTARPLLPKPMQLTSWSHARHAYKLAFRPLLITFPTPTMKLSDLLYFNLHLYVFPFHQS